MTKVLIAGGSGLVGKQLAETLQKAGHEVAVLGRDPRRAHPFQGYAWNPEAGTIDEVAFMGTEVIINLAGEPIVDKPWTAARKKALYTSRVDATRFLKESLQRYPNEVKYYIGGSAVGYYGLHTPSFVGEQASAGTDFMARLCADWEKAHHELETLGIKVGIVRLGIVLDSKGGFLTEFSKTIRSGIGSPLGPGTQHISWIHNEDLAHIFLTLLSQQLEGVYNAVAPHPVTNREMTRAIAAQLGKKIWLPAVPAWLLGLVMGERKNALLADVSVSPEKLLNLGFRFRYEQLAGALRSIYKNE